MIPLLLLASLLCSSPTLDTSSRCDPPSQTQCYVKCYLACGGAKEVLRSGVFVNYEQSSDGELVVQKTGCQCRCKGVVGVLQIGEVCHWFDPPKY